MEVFLLTLAVFFIAIFLMAVGILLGRKPMRSGCHAAREDMGIECAAGCESPCFKRRARQLRQKIRFFKKSTVDWIFFWKKNFGWPWNFKNPWSTDYFFEKSAQARADFEFGA